MPAPSLVTRLLPALVLTLAVMPAASRATAQDDAVPVESQTELPAFLSTFYTAGGGGGGKVKTTWTTAIAVSAPGYCTSISGDTTVSFKAPGMTTVHALCWQQPTPAPCQPRGA